VRPAGTAAAREARLEAIAREVLGHVPCGFAICEEATHLVPGEGAADARVVLVGEAPGGREDATGRPFVGAAGKLLDLLLEEAGLARSAVFITNVVKARPPGNRDPRADEVAHHRPWLDAQLQVIAPEVVVPLGRHAMGHFLSGPTITEAHGQVVEADGRRVLPWFHPAAALHNQRLRETLFADARALRDAL
jgi:uracil-DNA glycosylase